MNNNEIAVRYRPSELPLHSGRAVEPADCWARSRACREAVKQRFCSMVPYRTANRRRLRPVRLHGCCSSSIHAKGLLPISCLPFGSSPLSSSWLQRLRRRLVVFEFCPILERTSSLRRLRWAAVLSLLLSSVSEGEFHASPPPVFRRLLRGSFRLRLEPEQLLVRRTISSTGLGRASVIIWSHNDGGGVKREKAAATCECRFSPTAGGRTPPTSSRFLIVVSF